MSKLFATLNFIILFSYSTSAFPQANLEPEDGKVIYGIGQDSIVGGENSISITSGQLTQVHDGIEKIFEVTGKRPMLTHFYVGEYSGSKDINAWTFEGRLARLKRFNTLQNRRYLPIFSFAISNTNQLANFLRGDYDHAIINIGRIANAEDTPMFFRPFYEFNQYGAHDQLFKDYARNNPAKTKEEWFLEVWKKFRNLVNTGSNNSKKIAFVWCMNAENDYAGYYPGNEFVDWIGIDIFNSSHLRNASGPILTWIKNNTDRGDGKPKPIILPEVQPAMTDSGEGSIGTHAKQEAVEKFFAPFFAFMENNYEVKGFVYINYWFNKLYMDDPIGNAWLKNSPLLAWGDGRLQPILESGMDTTVFDYFSKKIGNHNIYLYEGDDHNLFIGNSTSSPSSLSSSSRPSSVSSSSRSLSISSSSRSSSISSSSRSSISSSNRSSRLSSSSRSSSSSSTSGGSKCQYVITNQWNTGFTAAIRITNSGSARINGWSVSWTYTDGARVTNLWNAVFSGSNPYSASNMNWNGTIQPGQTVEFGFQGTRAGSSTQIPVLTGSVCN
jgi:Cellulose binding domain/Glycosyl hydrolase family 26